MLVRAITDSLVAFQNSVSEQDLFATSQTLTRKQHDWYTTVFADWEELSNGMWTLVNWNFINIPLQLTFENSWWNDKMQAAYYSNSNLHLMHLQSGLNSAVLFTKKSAQMYFLYRDIMYTMCTVLQTKHYYGLET